MNANGMIVRNNHVNVTPTVTAFLDLAVRNREVVIDDMRQHMLAECWSLVEASPENQAQMSSRDMMLSTGFIEITDEQNHMAIHVASVLENTHELDEDARLIIEHHVYFGTQDEIHALADYLMNNEQVGNG